MDNLGYLLLVLHAHLPFVRHPEHEDFLEEDWLYEAITETYIPLIDIFDRLVEENIDFRLTMSVTPPLASMLTDGLLQDRYVKHLDKLIELAEKEIERTRWQPEFNRLAHMYFDNFRKARYIFVEKYQKNLTLAFKKFQDLGKLDVITCGATHGYLPLMETTRSSVRAQIKVAADHYRSIFGRPPRGIWLPECGYNPGDDKILEEFGIRYFFVDTHGILHSTPRPKYGVFAPVFCPSGVAAFGRDLESSKQVWSSQEGYPGDFIYREFYRDLGFDLDFEYVKPYIHPDGIRVMTGIKYYRITGASDHKEPYNPDWARDKAADHAGNFMFNRERQVEYLHGKLGRKPMIVAPYDAELFGHWWYEGPQWLNFLIRKISCDSKTVKLITAHEYLKENPRNQVVTPSFSSWGYKGYSEHWLEGSNDWVYRHFHEAGSRMHELAGRYKDASGLTERALKQAARELLLAESSDWAFIMKTGTVVDYARRRVKDHILRFTRLYEDIKNGTIDEGWLSDLESKDNIFPNIDFRVYC
jgi:1,4-alpha-glucan branching enzyme